MISRLPSNAQLIRRPSAALLSKKSSAFCTIAQTLSWWY
jgi:hypothetical protein